MARSKRRTVSSGTYARLNRESRALVYASNRFEDLVGDLQTADSIDARVIAREYLHDAHLDGSAREADLQTQINVLEAKLLRVLGPKK